MPNISIITSSFPHYPGEWFLEEEIRHWPESQFTKITIHPRKKAGKPRIIPREISVDYSFSTTNRKERMVKTLINSANPRLFPIIFPLLYREVRYLLSAKKLSRYNLGQAVLYTLMTTSTASGLLKYIKNNGVIDVAYSYWNAPDSYAACLLKRRGLIRKVITRVHGTDLYENRRKQNYMPLKRQFCNDFDAIYALSKEARNYYSQTYNISADRISISPLGVFIPAKSSTPSAHHQFHILSVARCVPIKCIDKTIEALRLVAIDNPQYSFLWTHIGDGPLLSKLINQSELLLGSIENIRFKFSGNLSNADVRKFYLENSVDLFINTSESEGVPVSIMEAMSVGVPAIAPDVGGISELVTRDCGILISKAPDTQEIAKAITAFLQRRDIDTLRANARQHIFYNFNAKSNYSRFIKRAFNLISA